MNKLKKIKMTAITYSKFHKYSVFPQISLLENEEKTEIFYKFLFHIITLILLRKNGCISNILYISNKNL